MRVEGPCQICATALAKHSCARCGQAVCPDHWNTGVGACVACVAGPQQ